MDERTRNFIIASLICTLAAMYGGETLGSWFSHHEEARASYDGEDSVYESSTNFMLEEVEYEENDEGYKDSGSVDYDDGFDELEDLMLGKIKNLLFLVIIASFAALFFLSQEGDNEEMGANACLAVGVLSLLTAAMFALSFPEAVDDDLPDLAFPTGCDEDDWADDDASFYGSENCNINDDGLTVKAESTWRPGLAWVLMVFSGITGMLAYSESKH